MSSLWKVTKWAYNYPYYPGAYRSHLLVALLGLLPWQYVAFPSKISQYSFMSTNDIYLSRSEIFQVYAGGVKNSHNLKKKWGSVGMYLLASMIPCSPACFRHSNNLTLPPPALSFCCLTFCFGGLFVFFLHLVFILQPRAFFYPLNVYLHFFFWYHIIPGIPLGYYANDILLNCWTETIGYDLFYKGCDTVPVRNAAQESKMNALGSYLFHYVVNKT